MVDNFALSFFLHDGGPDLRLNDGPFLNLFQFNVCEQNRRGPVCVSFCMFWLPIAIESFPSFHQSDFDCVCFIVMFYICGRPNIYLLV